MMLFITITAFCFGSTVMNWPLYPIALNSRSLVTMLLTQQ